MSALEKNERLRFLWGGIWFADAPRGKDSTSNDCADVQLEKNVSPNLTTAGLPAGLYSIWQEGLLELEVRASWSTVVTVDLPFCVLIGF